MVLEVENKVGSVILNWISDNLWINIVIFVNLIMIIFNMSLVFKLFSDESKSSKRFYYVCAILFLLLLTTLLFIDMILLAYNDGFETLQSDQIVNHNYANIVFFSLLGAFAVLAFIFNMMYNGKKSENKHWFICAFVLVMLDILTLVAFDIYTFYSIFIDYAWLYGLCILIVFFIEVFVEFRNDNKNLFFLCWMCVISVALMFFYNFIGLFSNDTLVLKVNDAYYEKSFIPKLFDELANDLLISMAQLQFNLMNYEDQMNFINSTYVCNASVVNANTGYLSSVSSLSQLNQQILSFNQMLLNNIGNIENINVINQQILAVFNVAKNIARNYFINNFQYLNYFPDDMSFITWIYEIISLIKSTSYMNLRDNYLNYYVIDGNFVIFNNASGVFNTSYTNLYVNMSLSDLMGAMNMQSASINDNIISYNNQNVAMISNLYSADIFQNIFNFTDLNWNENVFAVTCVYNWLPYTFIFTGDPSGVNNLVGVMSNNYLLHLFDSNTSNVYRIDFINKKYVLLKCFDAFDANIYNSNNISFAIKNNGSFVFFQCIKNGIFNDLFYFDNNLTYEFLNTNTNKMWMFDFGNYVSNAYSQYIDIMSGNYTFEYMIYNKYDAIGTEKSGINTTLVTVNEATK